MTLLTLIAIILFGFATYNLSTAFADIPTSRTSKMMMLAKKQRGAKNEQLLDVYITKVAKLFASYLRLDRLKRNKLQAALTIAGLELTPEVYTARAWVTAGAVGFCALPMAFLMPLFVPVLIGTAVALWFSTYYAAFDFVKKRRKLIEAEIPRFALTIGQNLENDRDVLKILTYKIELKITSYMEGNLAVTMTSWENGEPELWNVLAVNLDSVRPQNCAFIDSNNNGEEILAWIIRHGLAVPTGIYARSGYCQYPEYRFRPKRLLEIDPEGYSAYLHDWKKRYGS